MSHDIVIRCLDTRKESINGQMSYLAICDAYTDGELQYLRWKCVSYSELRCFDLTSLSTDGEMRCFGMKRRSRDDELSSFDIRIVLTDGDMRCFHMKCYSSNGDMRCFEMKSWSRESETR